MNRHILLFCSFILLGISVLLPIQSRGQSASQVNLKAKGVPLTQAIDLFEERYDVAFTYDPSKVKKHVVKYDLENCSLDRALKLLLKGSKLQYKIINDQYIILSPKVVKEEARWLSGKIVDAKTGEGLGFAIAHIKGTRIGAYADSLGNFRLKGILKEQDSLHIYHQGYFSFYQRIGELQNSQNLRFELKMAPSDMQEILLRDRSFQPFELSDSSQKLVVHPSRFEVLPGLGEPDVLRAVQLLPGVGNEGESAGGLFIRGGTPDQSLVLWDGIPVYHLGHFFGMFSVFNPHIVRDVRLWRSGFDVSYGNRLSGLLEVTSEPKHTDHLKGGLGINLTHGHAYVIAPLFKRKLSLMVAARRSYTDLIQSNLYQKMFDQIFQQGRISRNQELGDENPSLFQLAPSFFFNDLNAKIMADLSPKDQLSLSFYRGTDRLNYNFQVEEADTVYFEERDELNLDNTGLGLNWSRQWNPRLSSTWQSIYTQYNNFYEFSWGENEEESDISDFAHYEHINGLQELSSQLTFGWQLKPNHMLRFGYQLRRQHVSYSFSYQEPNQEADEEAGNLNSWLRSSFISYQYYRPCGLKLNLGVRLNRYSNIEYDEEEELDFQSFISPRLSLHQPLSKKIAFKASGGMYQQFVSQIIQDNGLGVGEQFWVMADGDNFAPLESLQFTAGFLWKNKGWELDAEGYHKIYRGYSSLALKLDENPYTRGDGSAFGLDILLRKKMQNYQSMVAYSLSRTTLYFPELNSNDDFWADHDRPHVLKWTHLYHFKRWQFNASWRLTSGAPYTPGMNIDRFIDPENEEDIHYEIVWGPRNEYRLPAYHRLDVAASYRFDWGKTTSGKIGFSVFNFYNQENIRARVFLIEYPDEPIESAELVSLDKVGLPFSPNIILQLEW